MSAFISFFKTAGQLTPGAAIQILGPWFAAFGDWDLIGTPYQTQAKIAASTAGALAFFVAFAIHRTGPSASCRYTLKLSGIGFILSFCVVLALSLTLGRNFDPPVEWLPAWWTAWIALYLGIFGFLAWIIACVTLLLTSDGG